MSLKRVVCRHCGHEKGDHGHAASHMARHLSGRAKRGYPLTVLQCTRTKGFAAEFRSTQPQQGDGGGTVHQMS